MTRDELIARLKEPEGPFLERKLDGTKPSDIRKTIVAFANSVPEGREAILFVGVHDDGQIEGCKNPDTRQKAIRQICEQDCYPPIHVSGDVLMTEKGTVIAIIVGASQNRPHFSGPAYVRVGSESKAASPQVFDELIHSRNSMVAAILKHKNATVTVESIRHKLGDTRHIADNGARQYNECRIVDCNPQFITLYDIQSRETLSEPLSGVSIVRDEKRYRAKLIVRGI